MSTSRIDFSELVSALQEHNDGQANEILEKLLPKLKMYLKMTMNARGPDAEECIHQAFSKTYERIMKGKIQEGKSIFNYLVTASRNEYIRYLERQKLFAPIEAHPELEYMVEPANQMKELLDEERQKLLDECLDELEKDELTFITYLFDHPKAPTKKISKRFNISESSARAKKSRLTKRLHHCFKWKSEQ